LFARVDPGAKWKTTGGLTRKASIEARSTIMATPSTTLPRPPVKRMESPVHNEHVRRWTDECVALCQPEKVYYCTGSQAEREALYEQGVKEGVFIELNEQKWPGCYFHRSAPNDVARTEHQTFICTPSADTAGPTNNWMNDKQAYAKLRGLFHGCMKGRTMYVIPFVMGPLGSPRARVGVQLSDSIYVVQNIRLMTRMGDVAWKELGEDEEFTRCLHSVGDLNPERRYARGEDLRGGRVPVGVREDELRDADPAAAVSR
jgi:phosphoenolpyruvate carboxykinase (GTP)